MPWDSEVGWGGLDKRRLAWQNPIVSKNKERYVNTWEDLVQALGDYAAAAGTGPTGVSKALGGVIKFGSSFVWKSRVTVPSTCKGLTIDGNGYYIRPALTGLSMFLCSANDVKFRNIVAIANTDAGSVPWGTMFTLQSVDRNKIVDCYVSGAALVSGTNTVRTTIKDCVTDNSNSAVSWINLSTGSAFNTVANNSFSTSSSNAIVIGATSSATVISGNSMIANGIITSAGTGSNTIVGNAAAGTITNHATDAVGLNT